MQRVAMCRRRAAYAKTARRPSPQEYGEVGGHGAHGLVDGCAGAHRVSSDQGQPTAQFIAVELNADEGSSRVRVPDRFGRMMIDNPVTAVDLLGNLNALSNPARPDN